ncbi:damage-control phosphatase ARMT1-like [Branchiostoma floridae]|uniref:Sugar phosphate phosphatase n=1 Tax=Branchiostoma floridae TaxID=7739 RepID=A0A9J7KL37_BRAFL|nr:damage-control phosphatase ARMT1-like [Branchiostoma floridae]
MEHATLPDSLSAKFKGSFAYKTVKDRIPSILVKVIDVLARNYGKFKEDYGEEGVEDAKGVVGRLSGLRNEMQTDKPVLPLTDGRADVKLWNRYLEEVSAVQGSPPSWFTSAWLYVECYMYRRIQQAFEDSTILRTFDPFRAQKEAGLLNSESPIQSLASYVQQATQDPSTLSQQDIHTLFNQLIQVNLWGNKCDLSISGGTENYQKHDPIQQLSSLRPFIIVDQTDQIWNRINQPGASKRVDLIVDNAGFELFSDLVFAEMLLATKLADVVHFHLKAMPWFVSDALRGDFMWTLDVLRASGHAAVSHYGNLWHERVKDGTWVLCEHDFWTCPHDYSKMEAVAPDLYADLARSHLIVFKGDLNYRKITGDLKWAHTVPFSEALRGFLPSALCTLRTLKADLIVGLEEGQAERIEREAEEASDWMVSGNWAVVQYCEQL